MVGVREVEGKGRGIFALRSFQEGDLIERVPVLVIPAEEGDHIEQCILNDYHYDWPRGTGVRAIALGCGSLYNHSYQPNAQYIRRIEDREIDFVAIRAIAKGEEICINYNGVIDDMSPVWFDVVA